MISLDLGLLWSHIRSSYKMIVISSIGLIFALAIVSSTVIYVDTNRPTIFTDVLDQQSKYYPAFLGPNNINPFPDYQDQLYDLKINISLNKLETSTIVQEQILHQKIEDKVTDFNYEDKISQIFIQTSMDVPKMELNASYDFLEPNFPNQNDFEQMNTSVKIYEISNALIPELTSLLSNSGSGILPSNNEELLLFNLLPRNQLEISQNYNKNVSIYSHQSINNPPYSIWNRHEYNVSGIIKTNQLFFHSTPNLVNSLVDTGWGNIFAFVLNMKEFSESFLHEGSFTSYRIDAGIKLNYNSFNPYNTNQEVNNIKRLSIQLQSSIASDTLDFSLTYINVFFQTEESFNLASQSIEAITFGLLLFASPIILVTLFVANYSFGLIHRNVKHHFGILKTRGTSDALIFIFQLTDFLIIIFISIVTSIIAGIPLSTVIIRTDYFLSFNNDSITNYIIDLPNLINLLFWFGIIIAIIIHLARMVKFSKMTVSESDILIEQTNPYWFQHYLDFIFFILGFLGTAIFYTAVTQQWFDFGPFILLGLPAPLLLLIGTVLIFSRIFPIFLLELSSKIWVRYGGLLSFAIKNVIRHRQASTRAVMLIAILITFLISFLSIPYSNIVWKSNQISYDLGAEGVGYIDNFDANHYYNQSLINDIESKYSDYLDGVSPFMKIRAFGNQYTELLVINSSSFQTASKFPIDPETNFDLKDVMNQLGKNNSKFNLILQKKSLEYLDLNIGDNYEYSGVFVNEQILNFNIIDTFLTWPTLFYQSISSYEGENFYGVTTFDRFLETNYSFIDSSFRIDKIGLFFNFKDDINQSKVAEWLIGNFSISMDLLSQKLNSYFTSVDFLVQTGQLNLNIVISIMIALAILLMFAWLQIIERKKELFTERALGLKIYQLLILFLTESLILLFSGLIIGSLMGIGLTDLLGLFISLGPSIPPYQTWFAIDLIVVSFGLIIGLAFIGALIPAIYMIKQDISGSFAGEG